MTQGRAIGLIVLVIALVSGWAFYRHRISIEAWWWHERHGEVVGIGGYSIPAPKDWYVQDDDDTTDILTLIDDQGRTSSPVEGKKLKFTAVIVASLRPTAATPEKLDFWTRFQASEVRQKGVEPVFRRFDLGAETLSCVGGLNLSQALQGRQFYVSDPVIWHCWSSGALSLDITAAEADMALAWEIVAQIHKKS
jgi:hypothetical protein